MYWWISLKLSVFSKHEKLSDFIVIFLISTHLEKLHKEQEKNNFDEKYSFSGKQTIWLHGWSMTHL